MAGLFANPVLRMEMIDFQLNSKFGSKLEALVEKIYYYIEEKEYLNFEIQKLPEIVQLEKLIFDEIGLKVAFTTTQGMAAIIPFHISESAILKDNYFIQSNWFLNEQKELRENNLGVKGFVDEENVKLGGIFSEYTNTLYMEFNELHNTGLSVKEVVAVLLHELGHGFYACAYSARMDRANQVIVDALKNKEKDKSKYIETCFKKLKDNDVKVKKEIVEGLTSENPIIFAQSTMAIVSESIMTQMQNGKYDETSFEQLADNFSARFGYGEHIVTSLEKLGFGVRKERFWVGILTAWKTFGFIYVIAKLFLSGLTIFEHLVEALRTVGFKTFLTYISNLLFTFIWGFCTFFTSGEDGRNYTYDDTVKRYNRIRNQVIEAIKTKQLTKNQASECIATVEFIGNLIKDCKPYRGPLDFLFNTFNPKDRRAKNSIERQQAIEDLMANPMFVASLKAKLAAG